jgi:hypothetical protein
MGHQVTLRHWVFLACPDSFYRGSMLVLSGVEGSDILLLLR